MASWANVRSHHLTSPGGADQSPARCVAGGRGGGGRRLPAVCGAELYGQPRLGVSPYLPMRSRSQCRTATAGIGPGGSCNGGHKQTRTLKEAVFSNYLFVIGLPSDAPYGQCLVILSFCVSNLSFFLRCDCACQLLTMGCRYKVHAKVHVQSTNFGRRAKINAQPCF